MIAQVVDKYTGIFENVCDHILNATRYLFGLVYSFTVLTSINTISTTEHYFFNTVNLRINLRL